MNTKNDNPTPDKNDKQKTAFNIKEFFQRAKPFILTFLISIAIPLLVGTLAAFLTKDSMSVYSELTKPPLAPPGWLFPIVWTLLYILMGISSATFIIMRDPTDTEVIRRGLGYYGASLVLNFGWSIIFFNVRALTAALVWLIVLLYTVIKTIIEYKKVSPLAAYLQIPYIAWLCFAGYLNTFYVLFGA